MQVHRDSEETDTPNPHPKLVNLTPTPQTGTAYPHPKLVQLSHTPNRYT